MYDFLYPCHIYLGHLGDGLNSRSSNGWPTLDVTRRGDNIRGERNSKFSTVIFTIVKHDQSKDTEGFPYVCQHSYSRFLYTPSNKKRNLWHTQIPFTETSVLEVKLYHCSKWRDFKVIYLCKVVIFIVMGRGGGGGRGRVGPFTRFYRSFFNSRTSSPNNKKLRSIGSSSIKINLI